MSFSNTVELKHEKMLFHTLKSVCKCLLHLQFKEQLLFVYLCLCGFQTIIRL